MRRLLKKAKIDYSFFLSAHLAYNNSTQNEIQTVIDENLDCTYSGTGYRAFLFTEEKIIEALNQFLEEINETKVDLNSLTYYINNTMNNLIKVNGLYQCFAKSWNAADATGEYRKQENDKIIVIGCNIKDGLDIEKLVNKHMDDLSSIALETYKNFEFQQEVIAKFDDTEFFVPEAGILRHIFQKVERK